MTDPTYLAFLRDHHAGELGHSATSLLDHLVGTEALLEAWGAAADVATAGLFHAVYGTESFRAAVVPLDLRPRVRAVIGVDAEALAYRFGAMAKGSFDAAVLGDGGSRIDDRHTGGDEVLDEPAFAALCMMMTANWLEQKPRLPDHQQYKAELFFEVRRWLTPAAVAAVDGSYGFTDPPR